MGARLVSQVTTAYVVVTTLAMASETFSEAHEVHSAGETLHESTNQHHHSRAHNYQQVPILPIKKLEENVENLDVSHPVHRDRGATHHKHSYRESAHGERELNHIFVDGKAMACYLDGCMLICKGDQVIANLCETFKIDLKNQVDCGFDNCELKCGKTLVKSFCEKTGNFKGSRRTAMTTNPPDVRRLGASRVFEGVMANMNLWPKGEICYRIAPEVDSSLVMDAIAHWTSKTALNFTACPDADEEGQCCAPCGEYVHFVKMNGCWSTVGREIGKCTSGGQALSVGEDCDVGAVIHEIGHAVGLIHEHVRPDRDKFVRVLKKNIIPEHLPDFEKESNADYTLSGYDFQSIMHYGLFTFSRNAFSTLVPLDNGKPNPNIPIGQRTTLSDGDIASVHRMYSTELQLKEM